MASNDPPKKSSAKNVPRKPEVPPKPAAQSAGPGSLGSAGVALRVVAARPVELRHLGQPPQIPRKPRIHPRRLLPLVGEGKERAFHSATPAASIASRAFPARLAAGDDLALVMNTELSDPAAQGVSANVNEPSAAINGQVAFYTGNWYASVSTDGGETFKFIDPNHTAQPAESFCCDQVMLYLPTIDTFVWLLQYGPEKDNFQRLAFAKSGDVGADLSKWRMFDIGTDFLDVKGAFLDFPDLAFSDNFLYVTTNIFTGDSRVGAAVVRISLQSIAAGNPTAEKSVSMVLFSFRVAENCRETAYFAAHQDTSTLAVFSWPENQAQPTQSSVGVARWLGRNGYQSRTPDGRRWLDRADPRITGAALAGSELWFAWAVDRGSNQRPNPFVQIARISVPDLTLIENVNVFDTDSATCYGGLSSNANNEVAISYVIGGGPKFPSHVVGILTNARRDVMVAAGDRAPMADPRSGNFEWGDYLTVRPVFPDRKLFAATGYVLKGQQDGNNVDATPHFVIFGRAGDAPASGGGGAPIGGGGVGPLAGGGGAGPAIVGGGGAPTPVGDGPIDVNLLDAVNPAVAATIKNACMSAGQAAPMAMPAAVALQFVTKPGTERWNVKTGQDEDVALVGKNIIAGQNLGAGIVTATIEELMQMPRTSDTQDVNSINAAFNSKRIRPLELVIWQIDVRITAMKQEADGDYHLVLQGSSGGHMIGEIPTPSKTFIGTSPWMANIKAVRQQVDDKFVSKLSPADFVPMNGVLVPRASLSMQPREMPELAGRLPLSFVTPPEGKESTMVAFKTQLPVTRARLTGVGFFDRVHNQTGVSLTNGVELHPVLKIEFL
jgi:hypothetical protein